MHHHDSTIALTVYNLICTRQGSAKASMLFEAAKRMQHPSLTREQFDRAVAGLVSRSRVSRFGENTDDVELRCADEKTRLVVSRDLSDVKDKNSDGGWNRWAVRGETGLVILYGENKP